MLYPIATFFLLLVLGAWLLPLFFPSRAPQPVLAAAIALTGLMALLTFGLYAKLGSPELIDQVERYHAERAARQERLKILSTQLRKEHGNPILWLEVGDISLEDARYDQAVPAYRQAVLLTKGNPGAIFRYAEALILQAQGKVTPEAQESLKMVLLQQPTHPEARFLMILQKAQKGETTQARREIQDLLASLPADSPLRRRIRHQLEEWGNTP